MIEVKNVYKSFDQKEVLKNISTLFYKGKTNLIIGRSGSGKTVLLKAIVGLHEVDSGEILYDGRDFTRMGQKERKGLRREMGMVFQGGALFDSMTVEENVRFPLDMFSEMSIAEKQKQVDFCLDRVNIKGAHQLYPSEISGGMQKRVAIARAISLNPKYLFCDEPNSGLDPETALLIDDLIHDITLDLDITTIINTHDMNSVMEIGEQILFISEGEMCWTGNKEEILDTENQKLQEFVFANKQYQQVRDEKRRNNPEKI
ncbi:MAG: ABC transporter ATP-binding protein [Bacteroidetes bacterium GWF2_42_66]|nr:MAG: ABC transporter ATP-binding protein [Bacteroidetes bacterium GWA2_42_15]OFX98378.1 MAG: ABC transporter ATP-binding protein [Bacteroidetes bacterium GWE2_42_39]OFY42763.1 MAG: ABC transporter ATP-binding protein [Bacteroidetes bacterium GWF2_42_66]HBL74377.1 ABC transporter ATP-binding protein [Prolixibacteraceae bacterium]HCR91859.1 ABC transporter ATP-binding protein [Prolixibacteraceae bacterium]